MGSFKQQASSNRIEQAYFSHAIVVLESEEDFKIVADRWFWNIGDDVRFEHADDGSGGGANKVRDKVNKLRSQGETACAFGIVDRDAVKASAPDVWWEREDEVFKRQRPLGEHIRVLTRWELENYLLDPELVEETLANIEGRSFRRGADNLQSLYDQLEAVTLLSAADIVANNGGKKFGHDLDECWQGELRGQVAKKLSTEQMQEVDATEARIRNFGRGLVAPSSEHWDAVCRLIDGKRMLRRLKLLHKSLGHAADQRLELATKLSARNRIPSEFQEHVAEFRQAARDMRDR